MAKSGENCQNAPKLGENDQEWGIMCKLAPKCLKVGKYANLGRKKPKVPKFGDNVYNSLDFAKITQKQQNQG